MDRKRRRRRAKQRPRSDRHRHRRFEQLEPRLLLAVVEWSGDLVDGTVWRGDDVHVITGDVTVPTSAKLTIEAGAVVKLNSSSRDLIVEGELQAVGTEAAPIVFTSYQDDTIGGDTNGDGNATAPEAGDWRRIEIRAGGTAELAHAQLLWGGASLASVVVGGGSLELSNSSVSQSRRAGMRIDNSSLIVADVAITNSQGPAITADLSSSLDIRAVSTSGNEINGVQLDSGTIQADTSWDDPDVVYWLDGDVTVAEGITLTVAAGQVVKLDSGLHELEVDGTLRLEGTEANPVVFTSGKDDSRGGETNGDGSESSPDRGDWGGIILRGPNNTIEHTLLNYGGFSGGAVVIEGGELSLLDSTIRDSERHGLRIENSNPTITNTSFLDSDDAAISMDLMSRPEINGFNATGNKFNGALIDGGTLAQDSRWNNPEVVYVLHGDVTVPTGITLAVAPGQVVKVDSGLNDLIVQGNLQITGTVAAPVVFTDVRDDTAGGDTNGDADASSPRPNGGPNIRLESTGNFIDHLVMRYGLQDGMLHLDGGGSVVQNSLFSDGAANAIFLENRATLEISNSIIYGNTSQDNAGIYIKSDSVATIVNNTLDGNERGVAILDAEATLLNNLITHSGEAGIWVRGASATDIRFNDVYNPTATDGDYDGVFSQTNLGGNLSEDPLYIDPGAGNFGLQAGSPAIDAGTSESAPADDFAFRWRVDDEAAANTGAGEFRFYDLGALEFDGIPRAVGHRPTGELEQSVDRAVFAFREAMDTSAADPATMILSALGPNGAFPITNAQWLDGYQLELVFPPQATAGDYELSLSPDIPNASGQTLDVDADGVRGESSDDAYRATWTILPPRIVGHTPDSFIAPPLDRITFRFDRPMDTSSFDPDEDVVRFTGPVGEVPVTGANWTDSTTLEVVFDALNVYGFYEMVLAPSIQSQGGDDLDQNRDGVVGEARRDQYSATFTLANIAYLSGEITSDTTWDGLVIVEDDISLAEGVTLTIAPGTIVKMRELTDLTIPLNATLNANGTVAQPIYFTSIHDDTVGGDIDRNGTRAKPQAGDWRGIFVDGGTANIDHTILQYGGGSPNGLSNSRTATIAINEGGLATITNSRIYDSFFEGITVGDVGEPSSAEIVNSVIAGADRGIRIDGTVTILNSTFDDNRIGVFGHGGDYQLVNSIVSNSLAFGVEHGLNTAATIRYSNVWSDQGENYSAIPDATGTNGNISVDPKYRDAVVRNYRLDYGSPLIDAADGTAAPDTDLHGAPRYDDPRVINTGMPTAGGTYADMGAFEFVEGAASDIDLIVTAVSGPTAGIAGDEVTVEWTVRSVGQEAAKGSWHDAVYLSSDSVWTTDDILLGEFLHVGDLGTNQSYRASAEVTLPGVLPGDYYFLVRTNSHNAVFEGRNLQNNADASQATVKTEIARLSVGASQSGTISRERQHVYRVDVPSGVDIRIVISADADANVGVFAARERIPTSQDFDNRATASGEMEKVLTLSGSKPGIFYVSLNGDEVRPSTAFNIDVRSRSFGIDHVQPERGGNAGQVTVTIVGARFDVGTTAMLVSDGSTIATATTQYVESGVLYATFDLIGQAPRIADVAVKRSDGATVLSPNAFEIVEATRGRLETSLVVPSRVRLGREYPITITYRNTGDTDQPVPLLILGSDGTDQLGFHSNVYDGTELLLLGVNSQSPIGTLPPGATGEIKLFGMAGTIGTISLSLEVAEFSDAAIPWNALGPTLRPDGISDAEWNTTFAAIQTRIGNTWTEYQQALSSTLDDFPASRGLSYRLQDVLDLLVSETRFPTDPLVTGKLQLDGSDQAAGGVELHLWDPMQLTACVSQSLSNGHFSFDCAPGHYELQVPGLLLSQEIVVDIVDDDVDLGTVDATRGAKLHGVVRRADNGVIVRNATVAIASDDGAAFIDQTDVNGSYEFTGLPDGTYDVVVRGNSDFATATATNVTVSATDIPPWVAITVPSGESLRGTVRDDEGTPVAGALLVASLDPLRTQSVESELDGTYQLKGLENGIYTLTVRKAGFATTQQTGLAIGDGENTRDVTMVTSGSLHGAVRDTTTQEPIPFAFIVVQQAGNQITSLQTNADGVFQFADLEPGAYDIQVVRYGYVEQTQAVTVIAGQDTELPVTLSTTGRISGRVTDQNGTGVSHVRVNLVGDNESEDAVQTDDNGNYEFVNLPIDSYSVWIGSSAGVSGFADQVALTEQDSSVIQDWNLGSLSRVSGRVVQADGITPIENASVNLAVDGLPVATINTDADGYYDVRVLRPGTYDLWAATFGASFSPHLNVDITATTDLLGLNFRAGSESVSGRVLDELFQQPIGDATVHISVPGLGLLGTVNETQTDEEGVFSFSSISPGIYELQIETRNLAPIIYSLEVTDASSAAGETPSIYESFFLGPSRRIYGRVVDTDDGEPVAEALVTVSGTTQRGGIFRRQVATDADGNWEMDAPVLQATSGSSGSPDTYSVTIAAPDYEQSTETYTTGPSAGLFVSLKGSPIDLTILVVQSTPIFSTSIPETMVSGAVVRLDGPDVHLVSQVSENSTVVFSGLPSKEADYTITVTAFGLEPKSTTVHLPTTRNLLVKMEQSTVDDGEMPRPLVLPPLPADGISAFEKRLLENAFLSGDLPDPEAGCEEAHDIASVLLGLGNNAVESHREALTAVRTTGLVGASQLAVRALEFASAILKLVNSVQQIGKQVSQPLYEAVSEIFGDIRIAQEPKELNGRQKGTKLSTKVIELGLELNKLYSLIPRVYGSLSSGNFPKKDLFKVQTSFIKIVANLEDIRSLLKVDKNIPFLKAAKLTNTILGPIKQLLAIRDKFETLLNEGAEIWTEFKRNANAIDLAYVGVKATELAYFAAREKLEACNVERRGAIGPIRPPGSYLADLRRIREDSSNDPNDKKGNAAFGPAGYLAPEQLAYRVDFENDPDAGATIPAQEVFVTDVLDDDLDLSTLEFTSFGFNNFEFEVPKGLSHYETTLDLRPDGIDLLVPVILDVDFGSRVLSATFRSLDPLTALLPDDIDAGFLPVNDKSLHNGEGFFSYLIRPKVDLSTGTEIRNQANIVFDVNEPILTPETLHTIDDGSPTSSITALPETVSPSFDVTWSGSDDAGGSGIAAYDIYVSTDDGPFVLWLNGT
ncbi:MAG: carboxypeptidase regulatory-like domain-containing protein, partial [Planctomycetales bacterium]|nr:carboxypeptidase regulatory-like domain-containing protein [Planctomycetales bacterium]